MFDQARRQVSRVSGSRYSASRIRRRRGELQHQLRRQLRLETLEARNLLTVNVLVDAVTLNATVQDAVDPTFLAALDQIEEANDTRLSASPDNVGFLRVTDPFGVIAGPGAIQISPTEADIPATPTVDVDLQGGDDVLTFANNFADVDVVGTVNVVGGSPASGSDFLRLEASVGVAESVVIDPANENSTAQDITGYAGVSMNVNGYEVIKYLGSDEDDSLEVELDQGVGTARVENAGTADTDVVRSNVLPDIEWEGLGQFILEGSNEQSQATFVTNQLEGAASYLYRGTNADTLIIEGTDSADDSFTVSLDGSGDLQILDDDYGTTINTEGLGEDDRLQVNTLGGDDFLNVSVANTPLITVPIMFDGGLGSGQLRVSGTPSVGTVDNEYWPGPQADEGRLIYDAGGIGSDMVIDFTGLGTEFSFPTVFDLVPTVRLAVRGTDSDNAINYTRSFNPGFGKVAVDDFQPIHFANKERLSIFGLGGNDVINLNNDDLPTGLLGSIAVDGGDPTADSDSVVLNGTDGADVIGFVAVTDHTAAVLGAGPLPIVFGNVEHAVLDGQGGGDVLTIEGTAEDDTILHTPGEGLDEGAVRVNQLLGLSYENLGIAAGASLTVDGLGGDDELVVEGTASSDGFEVAATTGATTLVTTAGTRLPVQQASVESLRLEGLEGDDRFLIFAGQPYDEIEVEGGGPGNSDLLEVFGSVGTDDGFWVTPEFVPGDGLVAILDGGGVVDVGVSYRGIEDVLLEGDDGEGDTVAIFGDGRDNVWHVGSGTRQSGLFAAASDLVQIEGRESIRVADFDRVALTNVFGSAVFNIHPTHLDSFATSFTVNGGAGTPDDVLRLHGTEANDVVTSTADMVVVNDVGITAGIGLAAVEVLGLGGSDTVSLALDLPGVRKRVEAGAGNDSVDLRATVDADIYGGDGDDILIGSPAADRIYGGRGDDQIAGQGGDDVLYGEEGDDRLLGGEGSDRLFGGDGSDTIIWNPGDGSDLVEGDGGQDIMQFVGRAADDDFRLAPDGSRLRVERQPGDVVIDAAGIEQVDLNSSMTFVAPLSGGDEVPPVITAASGLSLLTFDSTTGLFDIELFVFGIAPGDLTGSHIHVGAAGVDGPIIFPLGAGAAYTDEGGSLRRRINGATFPAANIPNLLAGDTYVNVHTTANPGGEIRGQLVPVSGTPDFGGSDSFIVDDLTTTGVTSVNLGLGLAGDASEDEVTVHGRTVEDNLLVTEQDAIVHVAGVALDYDVNIGGAVVAEDDRLTVMGHDGDDHIKAAVGVEDTILITLDGGDGDDALSADAILIGGPGDDFLEGGAGDDSLFGNAGEDTMIGGGGQDTYDGGTGFDTILIEGTAAADMVDVRQSAAGVLEYTVIDEFGVVAQDATTASGTEDVIADVEEARVEAGGGGDTVRLAVADGLHEDAVRNSLRMTVDGGGDGAFDRLAVVDVATPDLSILRQSFDGLSGSVEIGPGFLPPDEPFLHLFEGIEFVQVVADALAPTAPVNVEDPTIANRLVVFKDDVGEANNDRHNATHLGAGTTVNIDPTIDPGPGTFGLPADTDWYRVEALATGTIDFQVVFEQVAAVGARPGLPGGGDLNITAFDATGDVVANFTTSDDNDDNERVRIPAVQGEIYYFQVVGDANAINAYDVTAINLPAATPFGLELDDQPVGDPPPLNSDTGRSQHDNVTRDSTPTIILRLDDALFLNDLPGNDAPGTPLGDNPIPIPFRAGPGQPLLPGYAVAIFDEGDTPGGPAVEEPQTPLGFASMVEPGVYAFTVPNPLALSEGSHFLTARVQMIDPANPTLSGFGPRSEALEIVVDLTPPPASLGQPGDPDDGLRPESDTGVSPPNADTISDRVTSDTTPTFWGRAEADAIIRMYADRNGNGVLDIGVDVFLGQDTAIPLDGTNQEPDGYWEITSAVELNDETFFPVPDGLRTIFVTAEDVAGNVNAVGGAADTLEIFVDTVGPVIEDAFITSAPGYDLFDPKPVTDGPTPPVDSLTLTFSDLPNRTALDFLFDALKQDVAEQPGHYRLMGDHNGVIPIDTVIVTNLVVVDGQPAEATVELQFEQPLPDDRFTLTVSDAISDPVGNSLDGENNAIEPQETPLFPTGDHVPGGGFTARFTVDSRPEIGTISQALVYVDINGNLVFDPEGQDKDATNRDFVYQFGSISDGHFAGNFANAVTGIASGFDKVGAYGLFNGQYSFLVDTDDNGVGDLAAVMPLQHQVNGIPVAGDFSPAGDGDEFGLFDGQAWYLDVNGNQQIDVAERLPTNYNGLPLVGDFNGDGSDDLAVFDNATNTFTFDTDRNGTADSTWAIRDDVQRFLGLSGFTDRPVAGDLNLDGIDDIGLWIKGRQGILPKEAGEFFFWLSDTAAANPADVFDAYSPAPLGNDLFAQFGDETALPIFGNFDPPVSADDSEASRNFLNNAQNPSDVNNDGLVTAVDALMVINALNRGLEFAPSSQSARALAMTHGRMVDTNNDGTVTPTDALRVINSMNRSLRSGNGGEGEADQARQYAAAVDLALASPEEDDEQVRLLSEDRASFRLE